MNTTQLAERLAADGKLTKTQGREAVDVLLSAVREALASGQEVNLPGFGKFKVQDKPARTGRNPATGAVIEIAASKKVAFAAAKALKDAVAG